VLPGERLPVHGVGQQHFRGERVRDRQAPREPARVAVAAEAFLRVVGAEEDHLPRPGPDQIFDDGGERYASPAGGAHEAVHPDAAVPAALEGRHRFPSREPGQLIESKCPDRGSAPGADRQPEGRRSEVRDLAVVEDEELPVRHDLSGDAGEVGVAGAGAGRQRLQIAPGEDAALAAADPKRVRGGRGCKRPKNSAPVHGVGSAGGCRSPKGPAASVLSGRLRSEVDAEREAGDPR